LISDAEVTEKSLDFFLFYVAVSLFSSVTPVFSLFCSSLMFAKIDWTTASSFLVSDYGNFAVIGVSTFSKAIAGMESYGLA
jgi:hypothetical protein